MNIKKRSAPERLTGQSHPAGSDEARAALDLRSAANLRLPGPAALARVKARLDASTAPSLVLRRHHWKTVLAVVTVSVAVGGVTGAAVWVAMPLVRRSPAVQTAPLNLQPATGAPIRHGASPRRDPPEPSPATDPPVPSSSPVVAVSPPPAPAPVPVARRLAYGPSNQSPTPISRGTDVPSYVPSDTPPEPAERRRGALPVMTDRRLSPPRTSSPDLAGEAQLLAVALRRLHRENDPKGALAVLDEHAVKFPAGALSPEATLTRIGALLAMDRRESALRILDGWPIPATTRGRELLVVRAELRAGAKRCAEAVSDFTRALDQAALREPLDERALHGRAACHLRAGDDRGARKDLEEYLMHFPEGRFASASRRALSELGSRK